MDKLTKKFQEGEKKVFSGLISIISGFLDKESSYVELKKRNGGVGRSCRYDLKEAKNFLNYLEELKQFRSPNFPEDTLNLLRKSYNQMESK
ncbi:hypothetical protein CMI44_01455 [Candidatus Pacearchaeota archaeon]|jgi:hypothetical protein|nr:hypothetical protein [Candidatus Pacearchaeota archaeon]|tara:strand:+ start:778 stop:1050 length:273 start_codon:yes stop_codon:yes gene_type:complete